MIRVAVAVAYAAFLAVVTWSGDTPWVLLFVGSALLAPGAWLRARRR